MKDIQLALSQAEQFNVAMPIASATELEFGRLISSRLGEGKDFGSLLLLVARDAGLDLIPTRKIQ